MNFGLISFVTIFVNDDLFLYGNGGSADGEILEMQSNILQLLSIIHLLNWCDGFCQETDYFAEGTHDSAKDTMNVNEYDYYDERRYEAETEASILLVTGVSVDCQSVVLPLSWNKKTNIDYNCRNCTQTLTISWSDIPILPSAAFREFSTITILRMDNVHLEQLKPGAFNSLHLLEQLYLQGNELTYIGPGIFNSLSNLEILDLSNNMIRNISEASLTGMIYLKQLNLSLNRLVDFKSSILDENPIKLKNIDLSFNLLSHFDIQTGSMNIESLNLSSNNISELNFCPFNTIELNMSRNYITLSKSLTDCSSQSTRIVHFDASNNNISEINSGVFSNLSNLRYMNLQYNNIPSIPTGLFSDMSALVVLNLTHNQLEQFGHGSFGNLENLLTLDISHNKITSLGRF
ncbi:hypothetical protein JTB14_018697 [Gonioctena quinquepunctata]|nr:hypothetical protein JTB14_018697 [Gonioctena quinquepunctata]